MALWNVSYNGEEVIMYSDGALSLPGTMSPVFVRKKVYRVPYSNVGKGGISTINGKTYHLPSWIEVHPQTTLDDIIVEKKPFQELFVEPKSWKYQSSSSDKEYTVKLKRDGTLYCDCWGYIAHRNCKHIKATEELI